MRAIVAACFLSAACAGTSPTVMTDDFDDRVKMQIASACAIWTGVNVALTVAEPFLLARQPEVMAYVNRGREILDPACMNPPRNPAEALAIITQALAGMQFVREVLDSNSGPVTLPALPSDRV